MLRDAKLQAEVEQELRREPSIRAENIGVSAKNGVVELDGYVDSLYEKSAAERAAMRVANVRAVASEIKVVLPLSAVRTDEDIAQNALNHLEWDFLSARNIKVKVTDGWVTLLGSVEWQFQKQEAERVVRHLMGVKGVTNEIEIQPKISVADLKADIEDAFKRNAAMEASHVNVETFGPTVILRGEVRSWLEREEAERVAWAAAGVSKVENHIAIRH